MHARYMYLGIIIFQMSHIFCLLRGNEAYLGIVIIIINTEVCM